MDAQTLWQVFLETGAPEAYLLYNKVKHMEERYVPDAQRSGASDHGLQ